MRAIKYAMYYKIEMPSMKNYLMCPRWLELKAESGENGIFSVLALGIKQKSEQQVHLHIWNNV